MPREASGAGWIRGQFNFYVPLPSGTGAVEFVTDMVPGFKFYVEAVKAYVVTAGTGTSASRTLRLIKTVGTTDTTVATTTLLLAETDTVGKEKVVAVTAANAEFLDSHKLTLDVASGGTAFTAGALNVCIQYRTRPQQL